MPVGVLDTVVADLPLPLGGGQAIGVPPTDVDVMVDRQPLWLAISGDTPYQRETAPYQKDQSDQQGEAGEQSLAGWWMRSQMSFHFGAGLDYLDTTARPQPEDRLRFKTSRNVDVWTPGLIKPLNGTSLARTVPAGERVWLEPADNGLLVLARPNAVEVWDGVSWTSRSFGSAYPIRAFAVDGVNFYAATLDGVWKGTIASATAASKVYTLPSTDVPMQLGWVKQRLMLGHGAALYELGNLTGAGTALPTARYTHPVSAWTWSAITECPTGIVAAGYAGLNSGVFRMEITSVNDAPVLGPAIALMTLPRGERVTAASFYLGSLLLLGTNLGVRVCSFDGIYSTITLGPLSVETSSPVNALAGYGTYAFAGSSVNGETSLLRVDLSAPLDDAGHYAWAPDLPLGAAGTVTAVTTVAGGYKAVGCTGTGVYLESATPDGTQPTWLQTARIRMGTVEDKFWVHGILRGAYSITSPVTVAVQTPQAPTSWVDCYTATVSTERFDLRAAPGEWLALRFTLGASAQLASYQLQALPAGRRQRLIQLPVSLANYQTTRSGVAVGYDGWARDRLAALEALESSGSVITVSAPALFPEAVQAVIEKLSFVQPWDPGDRGDGTGGVLQILLRTVS